MIRLRRQGPVTREMQNRAMLKLLIYVLAFLLIAGLIKRALADDPIRTEIRAACETDARSHCPMTALLAAWLGDDRGVTLCFRHEHQKFSRHCRDVLAKYKH